jgi:hypothetical protein
MEFDINLLDKEVEDTSYNAVLAHRSVQHFYQLGYVMDPNAKVVYLGDLLHAYA